jgi:hypothetical protein
MSVKRKKKVERYEKRIVKNYLEKNIELKKRNQYGEIEHKTQSFEAKILITKF